MLRGWNALGILVFADNAPIIMCLASLNFSFILFVPIFGGKNTKYQGVIYPMKCGVGIGGSKVRGAMDVPPCGSNFFHFHAVFDKTVVK